MTAPKHRTEKQEEVLTEYPGAHAWFNCMEGTWIIWAKPLEPWPHVAGILGEHRNVEVAWADAARRLKGGR